jgi:hypothetical protein
MNEKIKCILKVPQIIKKENIYIAHKLISGNFDNYEIDVITDSYTKNEPNIGINICGGLLGRIPKSWLTEIKDKKYYTCVICKKEHFVKIIHETFICDICKKNNKGK